MALKVWLPLNGNLNNQGISNTTIVNNGATVYDYGQIGKCYNFNSTDSYISLAGLDLFSVFKGGSNPFTIAFWIYHSEAKRAIIFGDWSTTGAINFNIELTANSHIVRFYWNGSPDKNFGSDSSVGLSTWTHIVITYDGNKVCCYKNGIHVNSDYSGTLAAKNKTSGEFRLGRDNRGSDTAFGGRLNDFRIYNHCLSLAEIKELAKGLAVHYSFNDRYVEETTNVSTQGTWSAYTSYWTIDSQTTDKIVIRKNTSSSSQYVALNNTTLKSAMAVDDIWTMSCYLYKNDLPFETSVSNSTTYGGFSILSSEHRPDGYFSFTARLTAIPTWLIHNEIFKTGNEDGQLCEIRNMQWEKKDHATPFTYDSREMSMVKDVSGMGNDGIVNSSVTTTADTMRYEYSTKFNNSQITAPFSSNQRETMTYAVWVKLNAYHSERSCLAIGASYFTINNSGKLSDYAYGKSSQGYHTGSTTIPLNTWAHVAIVWTPEKVIGYVNGKKDYEIATTGTLSRSLETTSIGREGASGRIFNGQMSDFRIYATALTNDDIRQLYETSAKIDKNQNIHTFELNESVKSRELIAGAFITNNFGNRTANIPWNSYNENGEIYMVGNCSCGSHYLRINPTGKTYYYDFTISASTGNQIYIGFERYDVDKTSRSNQACVYAIAVKPTSDIVKQRYKGTINLATDGVNPTDTICLRILNGWSGSASDSTKIMTIHNMSLREVDSLDKTKILHTGLFNSDEFKEYNKAEIYKDGIVEAFEFIEK